MKEAAVDSTTKLLWILYTGGAEQNISYDDSELPVDWGVQNQQKPSVV